MKVLLGILGIGLVVLVVAMLTRSKNQVAPSPSLQPAAFQPLSSPSPSPSVATMTEDATGVKVIEVSGNNFRFNPATITVNKGDRVRVVLTSVDMQHDFNVDELDVDGPIAVAGEKSEVEFTADQAGKFEYYCSVGQHRANGMVGTLTVL
jgi:plastocyanin